VTPCTGSVFWATPAAPHPSALSGFTGAQNVWAPTGVMALGCAGWSSPPAPFDRLRLRPEAQPEGAGLSSFAGAPALSLPKRGDPSRARGAFQCSTRHAGSDVLSALKPLPGEGVRIWRCDTSAEPAHRNANHIPPSPAQGYALPTSWEGGRGIRTKPPELPSTAPWVRRIAGAQGWAGPHPPSPLSTVGGEGGGSSLIPPLQLGQSRGQGGEDLQRIRAPSAKNSTPERGCVLPHPPGPLPGRGRHRADDHREQ